MSQSQSLKTTQSPHLGGTVNIFLANGNGLVAVTDSLLSHDNVPVRFAQKLFKVDDHTICAIAGWYSSGGPTIDGIHHPAYEAIPKVINLLTLHNDRLASKSLDQKLHLVASGGQGTETQTEAECSRAEGHRRRTAVG